MTAAADRESIGKRLVIRPDLGWHLLDLRDLWRYHELVLFLMWRDISVRYKQTVLGAAWAIIQPFFTMVVFSVFFGRLAGVPSDGLPYPVWSYCALLPWQLFAFSLTEAGNSLVANQNLITKVYFPRLAIPLAATLAGLFDFAIAFIVLLVLMVYYGIKPTAAVWLLPLLLAIALAAALGAGLWCAALNVQYRDVRYALPFLAQIWLFLTPIAYPSSLVPAAWRWLYGLNPMVGVVEGFRWSLLGLGEAPVTLMLLASASSLVLLVTGVLFFERMERSFADVI